MDATSFTRPYLDKPAMTSTSPHRFQAVVPSVLSLEMDQCVVRMEAISLADMVRRSIHLLSRMVESGVDIARELPAPGRSERRPIMLTEAAIGRLDAMSEGLGLSMSQCCMIAFLWYRDVGTAQLEGRPFVLRGRAGEIDCTRLLLP